MVNVSSRAVMMGASGVRMSACLIQPGTPKADEPSAASSNL